MLVPITTAALKGFEELNKLVQIGEPAAPAELKGSSLDQIKQLLESVKEGIELNRKAATIHRDASNAKVHFPDLSYQWRTAEPLRLT